MMPTMKREEYEAMSLEELTDWAYENIDDITTEDILIDFAKAKIDDDNIYLAIHILKAIYESGESCYYRYDYNMGMLETPTPITCKEDLEDLIDFDEEEWEAPQ